MKLLFVIQEVEDIGEEGLLTDYVIQDDEDMTPVKEEDEVIIDDRQCPVSTQSLNPLC